MSGDTVTLRDHSQPCEHDLWTEENLVGAFQYRPGISPWECTLDDCPGGKPVTLRFVEECCTRCGNECDDHSVAVWVEVPDE